MEYLSDASFSSDSEDEDNTVEEIYEPRELDYWAIESLLESRGPPPIIQYCNDIGVVALRECVVSTIRTDIETVVNSSTVLSWRAFWKNSNNSGPVDFTREDWNAIGEFCMHLCECCTVGPSIQRIRSCIIYVLQHGKFRRCVTKAPRPKTR